MATYASCEAHPSPGVMYKPRSPSTQDGTPPPPRLSPSSLQRDRPGKGRTSEDLRSRKPPLLGSTTADENASEEASAYPDGVCIITELEMRKVQTSGKTQN